MRLVEDRAAGAALCASCSPVQQREIDARCRTTTASQFVLRATPTAEDTVSSPITTTSLHPGYTARCGPSLFDRYQRWPALSHLTIRGKTCTVMQLMRDRVNEYMAQTN